MKKFIRIFGKSLIILTFFVVLQMSQVFSQKGGWIKTSKFKYGMQINQALNGSGHGMLTDAGLILKMRQSEIGMGAFAQSDFHEISGLSFQYKYFFTRNKYLNLFGHYSFMYHYQNCLTNKLDQAFHSQEYNNYCEYEKFNTISHQIGFGIEAMLFKNIYLIAKVGTGGYSSQVLGEDNRNKNVMAREDSGFATSASIGISYQTPGKDKKRRFGNY